MRIRVFIADDHAIVRTGLRALIKAEPDFELIGEATGGYEALESVEKLKPDILVLDISMPDLDGISVIRKLKEKGIKTNILILTVHEDVALLRESLKAGASGYIIKHAAEGELISAIQSVLRGEIYIHPTMIRPFLQPINKIPERDKNNTEPLTVREEDVLKLLVQGYTNKEMAEELGIGQRTVESHRANLTAKLNIHSRVELLRFARKQGLVK